MFHPAIADGFEMREGSCRSENTGNEASTQRKRRRREDTRGIRLGFRHSSIALHPRVADDSGQALGLPPNHCAFSDRSDFGGVKDNSPFRSGLRS